MLSTTRFFLFSALALSACTSPAPASASLGFDQPITVSAARADSNSNIDVTASGGFRTTGTPVRFDLQALTLVVRTGDRPRLDQLVLPLGGANIGADALPPTGLQLRDLSLRVAAPVAVDVLHAEAQAIELRAHTPLTLSWSMVLDDGSVYRLGDVPTQPLDLDITLSDGDSGPLTTVTTTCAGSCWTLGGIGDLRDASLYIEAAATVEPLR